MTSLLKHCISRKQEVRKISGSLCERAVWKKGIKRFAKDGTEGFYEWLKTTGLMNLKRVMEVIKENATSWDAL